MAEKCEKQKPTLVSPHGWIEEWIAIYEFTLSGYLKVKLRWKVINYPGISVDEMS